MYNVYADMKFGIVMKEVHDLKNLPVDILDPSQQSEQERLGMNAILKEK
jgi:hypothetical protein